MELDLRFKQYEINAEQVNETSQMLEKTSPTKPHQEIIDFLENNRGIFSYKDLLPLVKNISGETILSLNDGSEVRIGVGEGFINLGIMYPDKSKFAAVWSNIADNKEFLEKCNNLKKKK